MAKKNETNGKNSVVGLGDLLVVLRDLKNLEPQPRRWGYHPAMAFAKCEKGDILHVTWIESWPASTMFSFIEVSAGPVVIVPKRAGVTRRALQKLIIGRSIKILQRALENQLEEDS